MEAQTSKLTSADLSYLDVVRQHAPDSFGWTVDTAPIPGQFVTYHRRLRKEIRVMEVEWLAAQARSALRRLADPNSGVSSADVAAIKLLTERTSQLEEQFAPQSYTISHYIPTRTTHRIDHTRAPRTADTGDDNAEM